jgi:hypothetical protein
MQLNSLRRMVEIMHILQSDTHRAVKDFIAERSQYTRRTYIRTFFAMIDGLTFQLKQLALERESEGFVIFSASERDQLSEDTKFVRTPENIRLSLDCLARAYGSNFKPAYGNHRWDSLKRAIGMRHHVTHPKKLEDLEISDADMQTMLDGMKWYHHNLSEVMRQCFISMIADARESLGMKTNK